MEGLTYPDRKGTGAADLFNQITIYVCHELNWSVGGWPLSGFIQPYHPHPTLISTEIHFLAQQI